MLALTDSSEAQQAVAATALDEKNAKSLRIAIFRALAESAKAHGNKLGKPLVEQLRAQAMGSQDLDIRTAASMALGALNLPSGEASEIIRAQHRG